MIRRKTYIKRSSKPIKRSAPIKKGKPVKRPKGYEDPEYRAWLKAWPCYVCLKRFSEFLEPSSEAFTPRWRERLSDLWSTGQSAGRCSHVDVAHVGLRGIRQKCKDREAMPLGVWHHRHRTAGGGPESHHTLGKKFWAFHGIDRKEVIEMLNRMYHEETGR